MDDLEFRRFLLADPMSKDNAFEQAKNSSADRQKLSNDVERLNQHIAQALDVPVPGDLYNKLILRQTMANHQQKRKRSRIHLAIAASITFVVGIAFNFIQFSSAYTNIGDYALAHVYHEAEHFTNDGDSKVSLTRLNQKMASFDGSFTEILGDLMFADYCRFDGMKSLHLVFKGVKSPVNIFVVPENEQLSFSRVFADQKLNGQSISFKDKNIIIVGDQTESLEQWRDNINKSIRWSI